jgi:hypothetical protein
MKVFFYEIFYLLSSVFSSHASFSDSAISSTTGSSNSTLAGLIAETTISSIFVNISYFSSSIFNSFTFIESQISLRFSKLTSKESTKFLGRHFTSISFKCSSNIAPSLIAFESQIKFK